MKKIFAKYSTAPELADLYPDRIKDAKECHFAFFRSPESFAAHVAAIDLNNAWSDTPWQKGSTYARFSGTKDMPEALNLAFEGWPDGIKKVAELREKILFARPQAPRLVKHDVAGSLPNVPRLLAGNPLHMKRIEIADSRRAPIITLMADMAVNCDCEAEYITRRAATIAALCDLIEEEGYRAHVVSCAFTMNSIAKKFGAVVATTCKEPYDYADVGRLSFGVGHSAFFRRLMFAVWKGDKDCAPLGEGLGYSQAFQLPEEIRQRRVYMLSTPSAYQFNSDTYAVGDGIKQMIADLTRQGCPCFKQESEAA
jgi:hypothetical protein